MANWIEKNGAIIVEDLTVSDDLAVTGDASAANVTATGSFIIGSADMNETDLEKLDGITNGTAAANKAVVANASAGLDSIGSIAMANFGNISSFHGATTFGKYAQATSTSVAISNSSGSALTQTIKRDLTGMTDNTATTVATITIPNAQNSATFEILVTGYLGAGGAIGAGEALASNKYIATVTRTAGVAAVRNVSSAFGAASCAVAGAATCTAVLTFGAVTGDAGATQTIAIQVTVTKSAGSSDNHVAKTIITCTQHQATGGITCT